MKIIVLLYILSSVLSTPIGAGHEPKCVNIIIPVTASAQNVVFPPYLNSRALGVAYEWLGSFNFSTLPKAEVSGTYHISATYCKPVVNVTERAQTIQLLLHP
jgi:hypothetical protein